MYGCSPAAYSGWPAKSHIERTTYESTFESALYSSVAHTRWRSPVLSSNRTLEPVPLLSQEVECGCPVESCAHPASKAAVHLPKSSAMQQLPGVLSVLHPR